MAILPATGAPAPPTVEELICAFANGACVCAIGDKGWCLAVSVAAQRVRNRVLHEITEEKRKVA